MTRAFLGLLVTLVIGALIVALTISSAYNPTPTNTSGGGPGSSYPGQHHASSYSRPIGGDGPQSS